MQRLFQSLLFLFVFIATTHGQIHEPVRFVVEQHTTDDGQLEIVFEGQIDKGWHVYGPDNSGGPVAATLTLDTCAGLWTDNDSLVVTSPLMRKMDKMFGTEVSYMEGKARLVKRFHIMNTPYLVTGYLTYGACNDQSCLPPTRVEFSFGSHDAPVATPATSASAPAGQEGWWAPVADQLQALGQGGEVATRSMWSVFLLGMLGGLLALLTPCVWPIIPMTVSFFLKRSKHRAQGIGDAVLYGVSIVVIYVALGLGVTLLFGASALNALSTNAVVNIFFFLLLLVFGASFLGGFDISLPGSWTNAVDRRSERATGLASIFLMAFTLSLVSFSCTGPIIGFLLVEVSQTGSMLAPTAGMLGFAIALALPFTLFALFPAWLKSVPRSGGWMNRVKVCLGFLELAFSLKFLSVADLAYGWHLLPREAFLALWIALFALLGTYLVGWIRFPHDEDELDDMGQPQAQPRTTVTRFGLALLAFAFSLYMVPGLWGAPCKAVSAFAPPISTQDFNLGPNGAEARFHDFDQGMRYAAQQGLPVMIDFTGYGCVNCRKMEAAVWTHPQVAQLINQQYVLITLYVDDKTPLPQPITLDEGGTQRRLRTVGDKWSHLQRSKFGANAQPFYVLLDNQGKPLAGAYSFDEDPAAFVRFLEQGVEAYNNSK